MTLKPIIAPSVLASDLSCLKDEAEKMIKEGCDWLHIDIMDGHFVNNLTIGPPVLSSLSFHFPSFFFDCHFMVSDPLRWIDTAAAAGCSLFTFHVEALNNNINKIKETIKLIREKGMKAGMAIKPKTDLNLFYNLINYKEIDLLLIMTVEPGFGGQKFMKEQMNKVKEARRLCPLLNIQVDGGLDRETVKEAALSGANVIVAGTSLYRAESPRELMHYMRQVIREEIEKSK